MLWNDDAGAAALELAVAGGIAVLAGGANALCRADIRASTVSMLTAR
jgi:hypothetical protein